MSDLDNEEIEATKKLQEKTADEMFEELRYFLIIKVNEFIVYSHHKENDDDYGNEITFYLDKKMIDSYTMLDIYELQAINKKCKELGWLD